MTSLRNLFLLFLFFSLIFSGCISSHDKRVEAVEKKDPSLCEGIPKDDPERDNCLYLIAVQTEDLELCGRIELNDMQTYCTAVVKRDHLLCKGISDDYQEGECIGSVAIVELDHSICDGINNQDQRDMCHEYVSKVKPGTIVIDLPNATWT